MIVWKLTRDHYSLITACASDLFNELDDMEPGNEFNVSCDEMSEEDFCNLPDFEGW